MTNVYLSGSEQDSSDREHPVTIHVNVQDEDWAGFNDLCVFRSKDGPGGPFEEITAIAWRSPYLPVDAKPGGLISGRSVNIVGETLSLRLNDKLVCITFTGSNPLTLQAVSEQIVGNVLVHLESWVGTDGRLAVSALKAGLGSKLEILSCAAQVILGLPIAVATGKDPRVFLNRGLHEYSITDVFGKSSYSYRIQFFNRETGAFSEPSLPTEPTKSVAIETKNVVKGWLKLADMNGMSVSGQLVNIHHDSRGPLLDGYLITGGTKSKKTDERGYVEFPLVRGQKYTVSVQNTNFARTFTTPVASTVTSFNFFDPSIEGDEDVFKVVTPELITAERRTF